MDHVIGLDEQETVADLDGELIASAPPVRHQPDEVVNPFVAGQARGEAPAQPLHRLVEAPLLDGLQQVVDRVHLERLDGVLVVGGDEDHPRRRRRVLEQQVRHFEAGEPRHLDVEKRDVGLDGADDLEGADAVVGLADDGDVLDLTEEEAQFLAGGLLVVGDHRAEFVAHEEPPTPAPKSGISMRTTVPRPGSLVSCRPARSP